MLLHVYRPQTKTFVFSLFFWTTSRKLCADVFAEVLKAKAGDLYDLDCKQDVSFLVRKSFTPKQQRLKMVISEALRRSPGKVVPVVPPSFFFSCFGGSVFFELFWGVKKPFADSIQYSISLENGPFKDFCSWHWIAIRHFLGRDRCGCSNTCLECWNQCRICTQPCFELCRVPPFWGPGRTRSPKKLLIGGGVFFQSRILRHSQSDDPGFSSWF